MPTSISPLNFFRFLCFGIVLTLILTILPPTLATGTLIYNGVAAGDATDTSVILWTRTADATTKQGIASNLTAQISTDSKFRKILYASKGATNPKRDYTLKLDVNNLKSGTRYYYRFLSAKKNLSPIGTFKTAPTKTRKWPSALV
jgi:alkaline phosphatase D